MNKYSNRIEGGNRLTVSPAPAEQNAHLATPVAPAAGPAERAARLADEATRIRRSVVEMIGRAGLGHIGGDLSTTDILATLFFAVLRVDPAMPAAPDRDRFILSKGHCAAALYVTLARRGFLPVEALSTFMQPLSALNGHPNRRKVPGVEANTGPLGHGLPIGVGSAIAARLAQRPWRTFVVLGDGELQEGSNWEAAMCAGHRRLDNLTAIVDRNRLQQGARTEDTNRLEPLAERWRSFGWQTIECNGHDHAALYEAFVAPADGRPRCVIAQTIKGKGVSFMEDRVEWHHKVPSREQIELALQELK
jgi:transketolase